MWYKCLLLHHVSFDSLSPGCLAGLQAVSKPGGLAVRVWSVSPRRYGPVLSEYSCSLCKLLGGRWIGENSGTLAPLAPSPSGL